MDEQWLPVPDYPGYEVSDHGDIRRNGRVLKAGNNQGYLHVSLCRNGIRKTYKIHRLVAIVFLPPIEGKETVDHIDRNPLNNHVSNLRWASYHDQNMNREYCLGVSGHRHIRKMHNRWVVQIQRHVFQKSYPTLEEAIVARDSFLHFLCCEPGDSIPEIV